MKRIVLADDHPLFLEGLSTLLTAMLPSVQVYKSTSLAEVKITLQNVAVDLILLDRVMPGMDGMKHLPVLRQQYPNIPIAIVSGSDSSEHVREAFSHGAVGFISKAFKPEQTIDAVKRLLAGEVFLPQEAWLAPKNNTLLSSRQMDIMRGIVRGDSNKVIASALSISEGTVKQHANNIFKRLKVSNRTLAIQRCRDLGLLS